MVCVAYNLYFGLQVQFSEFHIFDCTLHQIVESVAHRPLKRLKSAQSAVSKSKTPQETDLAAEYNKSLETIKQLQGKNSKQKH